MMKIESLRSEDSPSDSFQERRGCGTDGVDYLEELASYSFAEKPRASGTQHRGGGGAGLVAAGAAFLVGATGLPAHASEITLEVSPLRTVPTYPAASAVSNSIAALSPSFTAPPIPVSMVAFNPRTVEKVVEATVQVNGFAKETVEGKPIVVPALGSGFIIEVDNDYFVITNAHVVVDRALVDVTFSDNRSVSVELVGVDTPTDLAVLRLTGKGPYPTVTLGDSRQVQLGQPVYAVGSPVGLQNSVSAGIISGVNRSVASLGGSMIFSMLQTDAAINPGNSGGPLFNELGEVIGINAAHLEGNDNLAFSIPISPAKRVIHQIIEHGFATHSFVGSHITSLNHFDIARAAVGNSEWKVPNSVAFMRPQPGALIVGVERGTSAERAGLVSGDIITTINGTPVKEDSSLRSAIAEQKPGTVLTLGIVRGERTFTVTLPTELRPKSGKPQPFLASIPTHVMS